jgi:hypothetical protein
MISYAIGLHLYTINITSSKEEQMGFFDFLKGSPSPQEIAKQKRQQDKKVEEAKKSVQQAFDSLMKTYEDATYRALGLDAFIAVGIMDIGDMLDTIRDRFDPIVRLIVSYILIEQLSANYNENNSSVGLFAHAFIKNELNDEDIEMNEIPDDFDREFYNEKLGGVMSRITTAYSELPDDEAKNNICAEFCAQLTIKVDDDLKDRFIELAQNILDENGLMTNSAKSTFASLEL